MKKLRMKLFVFVGLIGLLLLAGPVQAFPVQGISVHLELSNPNIGVGDSFEMRVMAEDVTFIEPILSFGFDVVFDTAQFSWNWATVNPGYMDVSSPFTDVAGLAGPIPPVPDPGETDLLLATLGFTALSAGNHLLGTSSADLFFEGIFTSVFGDQTQNRYQLNSGIPVNVASVAEPATMLLLGAGLLGVAGFRRKFRK